VAGAILAIIVPHAGYLFSGQTAAFSYECASKHKVKRVFLLGPSHYAGFRGAALPSERAFATPLGDLQVDRNVIEELRTARVEDGQQTFPGFEIMPEVHRREHSLEMQLPFIKESFGDVKIVPIIVGILSEDNEIEQMGQVLRRQLTPDDLVIVSSDFTHYGPRYQYEPFKTNIRESVKHLDEEAFACLNGLDVPKFLEFRERTQDTICGFYPCALLLSMLRKTAHASLLKYSTSQDSLGEDDANSVSYMAIVFSTTGDDSGWTADVKPELTITAAEKTALLQIARRALDAYVREHRQITEKEVDSLTTPLMKGTMGVFVTLYKKGEHIVANTNSDDKELRGCIGYIFPVKSLVQSVIDNAIGAASRDRRFAGVTAEELEDLRIDINVLTPPKRIGSYKDIVVGRDGIVLYKNGQQAVFLPKVATEYGWNLDETLTQLSLKARCPADAWRKEAQFDVFQSISFEEP
jgi:hypothetical protein